MSQIIRAIAALPDLIKSSLAESHQLEWELNRQSRRWFDPQIESLECRLAMSADPIEPPAAPEPPNSAAPAVLMVLANEAFYYQDYNDSRQELEAAGFRVEVGAASLNIARPQWGTGQGADGGLVRPDVALANVDASRYSAVVFVGGYGASAYQYGFDGVYSKDFLNGSLSVKEQVNRIVNDFVDQDKYVGAICYGVTVLAWARVDGESLLAGRSVAAFNGMAPPSTVAGSTSTRWQIESNGGVMFASGSIGDPRTAADDVWVDGKIITAENASSARRFGQVLAAHLATPTVTIAAADAVAAEAHKDGAVFTITRSGAPLDHDLTVRYSVGGSATNGADFAALSGSVVIHAGESTATITLATADDRAVEDVETATLTLIDDRAYRLGADAVASVNIADNDDHVLIVIANQDFHYTEYYQPRLALEAAGFRVDVAATTLEIAVPHANSGQGTGSGLVRPDLTLAQVDAANYSAIVFVGGYGAASYQYAFDGVYRTASYNGDPMTKEIVNDLINDFVDQDKYVTALCFGISVLAWSEVDGASLIDGRTVVAPNLTAPMRVDHGGYSPTMRWQIEQSGANVLRSGSLGDRRTVADDVYVDGRIITGENYDSAAYFGAVLVDELMSGR